MKWNPISAPRNTSGNSQLNFTPFLPHPYPPTTPTLYPQDHLALSGEIFCQDLGAGEGELVSYWHLSGRGRDAAKHPTIQGPRDSPHNKIIWLKMSVVSELRTLTYRDEQATGCSGQGIMLKETPFQRRRGGCALLLDKTSLQGQRTTSHSSNNVIPLPELQWVLGLWIPWNHEKVAGPSGLLVNWNYSSSTEDPTLPSLAEKRASIRTARDPGWVRGKDLTHSNVPDA